MTEALCRRWLTPTYGDGVRLLPMSDDRVETHVAITDPDSPSGRRVVHFQEYWVKLRAEVPVEALVFVGLEESSPAPGVIDAITDADLVVIPPSNPVVSVGTILGVPRVREALVATQARVVGLSPIVGGHHLRGMAEQLLTAIGVEVSAAGGRPALRRPLRGRRARRLAGRRDRRGRRTTRGRRRAWPAAPSRC